MFPSITKLKLGYQDPGRNLNRTALDITVRSRDPSLFYPPATSPEAAHAAVAIQKFHSPSPEQGPNKWVNFCCGRFLLSMILSYVYYVSSCQLRSRQFTTRGCKVKSRAIYFRTLRAASRIEGATLKYTLY